MSERIFLDAAIGPDELRAKCKGLTQLQIDRALSAYKGKWMHMSGYVTAVTQYGNGVSVSVVQGSGADYGDYLWFDADHDRLELANLGDVLTAVGKIKGLSAGGLVFEACELSGISTPTTPIALFAEPPPLLDVARAEPPETSKQTEPPKRPLAGAEMERFVQLYLGIFADAAVEGKALDAVRACYPDHQIGRDAFFKKFREMRGPGKRGNPAFRGQ